MERKFKAPNGVEVIAINEIQADLYIRDGFEEVDGGSDNSLDLDALKKQAEELGIEYSANIGAKKLKERIDKHLAGE